MTTDSVSVRIANRGDIVTLAQFNCAIARETEGKQLDLELVTRGVTRGLGQGDEVVYFIAESGGQPVGALMLTREWSDWRDGWLVWIQSVYVTEAFRGQGVFRMLLEDATKHTRQQPDNVGMRLYVENDNTRAQAVYARTGFSDPHYKVLEKIF